MFILIGSDNTDIYPYIVGKFETLEGANNAMIEKAKDECYWLGLLEGLEPGIEPDDDSITEYWKNNNLEEMEGIEMGEGFVSIENFDRTIGYVIEEI